MRQIFDVRLKQRVMFTLLQTRYFLRLQRKYYLYRNRHLDLGDVSASNTAHFVSALNSDVQAIQVDFDDGHCPTWRNQLMAYNNIFYAVHSTGKLLGAPLSITTCPVLIFRPRAWNIIEHHILVTYFIFFIQI